MTRRVPRTGGTIAEFRGRCYGSRVARSKNSKLRDGSIDAGLYLLSMMAEPGQQFTHTDISIACGCHRGYISLIEKAALRKLRRKLSLESNQGIAKELRHNIP